MPSTITIALEVKGNIYLQKSAPGKFKTPGDLYVSPGVHKFRVIGREGDAEKPSNTVRTDFKANKRNPLTIELHLQDHPAAGECQTDCMRTRNGSFR